MTRLAQGDEAALEVLYDRYSQLVYTLAWRTVWDASMAEEVTLDVFTEVWQKANTYRAERAPVRAWLLRLTRHRAIDRLRYERVRPSHETLTGREMADDAPPAEVALQQQTRRQEVRASLSRLPPEQQVVVLLAYFQGLTQAQIADHLGLPLGTVKTRVRLALQKLRSWLLEEEG